MKMRIDELALFGGPATFDAPLHVGRPNIGNRVRLMQRIDEILDRNWLTNNGPTVQALERRIAELARVGHAVAVCNATIGLEVAIRARGMTGNVIVPSFTFVATAHALQWQGITPIFCDIDPRTHNLDPARVEALITPRVTGIIGVHVWGRPCAPEALEAIAARHNLRLLFDAAHALACSHRGRMIGGFGDAEVFSFHATKFINSFEGGAIVTNDGELARRMRLMTNFGFEGYDNVTALGTNGKMTEVCAAMGLTSLESIDDVIAVNRRNYSQYARELAGIPGVRLTIYDETEKNNFQYVVLEIDERAAGIGRDVLHRLLQAENVMARRYFYPGCHSMEPYGSAYPRHGTDVAETDALAARVLSLPSGLAVGPSEVSQICGLIRLAIDRASEIREHLARPASAAVFGGDV